MRYSIGNHCDSYILSQLVGGSACQNLYDVVYFDHEMFGQAYLFLKLVASFNGLYFSLHITMLFYDNQLNL